MPEILKGDLRQLHRKLLPDDYRDSQRRRRTGQLYPSLRERQRSGAAEVNEPLRETPFDRFFFRDPNGCLFEVLDVGWST
jgi:hypothetical protein